MTIYWKYNQEGVLMKTPLKNVIDKTWNSIEADDFNDVVPDGNGGVRVKTLDEKIQEAKQQKLNELKQNYISAVRITDARTLQYQKRKELGILTEDDETDYQEALSEYKTYTETYRQKKEQLESLSDLDAIKSFDTSIK